MPFKLSGWNAFYEGWLAGVLQMPRICTLADKEQGRIDGYDMAEETDATFAASTLIPEIQAGHILVEGVA